MTAKLSDLPTTSPDAIMAAIDLSNLAFWEARKEREMAEYRLSLSAWRQYRVVWRPTDLRPIARALTLTAWFNRADD